MIKEYSVDLSSEEQTPSNIYDLLRDHVNDLKPTINEELELKHALKIYVSLHVNFQQSTDITFITDPPPVFNSEPEEVLESTDIDIVLENAHGQLENAIDAYEQRGSGCILHQLLKLDIHVLQYDPLHGSTYLRFPNFIKFKKSCREY